MLVLPATVVILVLLFLAQRRGTAGVATLFTNALPIAAGVFVFGDLVPGGALGVLRIAAFVVVTAGAGLLASPEGSKPEPATGS